MSWNRINEFWVCLHCTTKSLYWTQKQEQKRTHGQNMSIDNTNILGTIHSNDKLETDETFSLENKSSENYHIVSDHVNENPASVFKRFADEYIVCKFWWFLKRGTILMSDAWQLSKQVKHGRYIRFSFIQTSCRVLVPFRNNAVCISIFRCLNIKKCN